MAATFTQNERVLCYHGPLVYEAKVLKVEHWDEATTKTGMLGTQYLVHYKGWKQTCVPAFPISIKLRLTSGSWCLMTDIRCPRADGTSGWMRRGC